MSTRLEIMVRNLKELERRAAMHGPGEAPLFLLNQIQELKGQIRGEAAEEVARLRTLDREGDGERLQRLEALLAAVQRGESAAVTASRVSPGQERTALAMQMLQPQEGPPQVLVHGSWAGDTGPQPIAPLYTAGDLDLVMQALATPVGRLPAGRFDAGEVARLKALGLVTSGHLLAQSYRVVGRGLYEALFRPEIEKLFHAVRTQARSERRPLALRLIFDAGGAALARYPWELIHDDVPLVADGVVDLTRYVAFPGPRPALAVRPPLRVLGIAPRPSDLPTLPLLDEPQAVSAGLGALAAQGALEIEWLSPPTRAALLEALQAKEVHVIHFDGHGTFGRLCPTCHILYTARSELCTRCRYPLSTVDAQGHLAFEDDEGAVNYVSARSLANALSRNQTQVVVLSACRSGQVEGGSVFDGVGPALIQAGVPAVVAMQLPIPVEDAVDFAGAFYAAVAHFAPLVEAVGRGRQRLYDERHNPRTWFVPTLYLRSDDLRGRLFQGAEERLDR